MRLTWLLVSASLLVLWAVDLAGNARAQDVQEVYLVRDVSIDATAESALQAKSAAIAEGQLGALRTLLRRLTVGADHERLPQTSQADVAGLIASYGVDSEKTSAVRYLARLTVQFQRGAIHRLLREAGVSFSETQARPTLVLPVFENDGRRRLFADDNAWLNAWSRLDLPSGDLLPLIVPLGDLGDMSALDAETALAPVGAEVFADLMDKYGTGRIAVIYCSLMQADPAAPARLNIAAFRYGSAADVTTVSAYDANEGEPLDALMLRAAEDIAQRMREDWKQRTVLRFGEEGQISARVEFEGLDGWLEVRRRLGDVPLIDKVEISAITTIDAQVLLHHLGELGQLNTALAAHDLRLEDRGGYWYLLRTDVQSSATPATTGAQAEEPASGAAARTSE